MKKYKNGHWLMVLALELVYKKYTKQGGFDTVAQKQKALNGVQDAFEKKFISDVYAFTMTKEFMLMPVKNS